MMHWHWIDWFIVSVIGISVLTGLFRGFVKECIALAVWILALWLSFRYIQVLDPWLQSYITDRTARSITSFAIIFLGILLAGAVINAILSFILKRSGLSGTDRLLGMGFGFIRGVLIVALMMLAVKMTSIPYQEYSKQSALFAKFDPLVTWLGYYTPDVIQHFKSKNEQVYVATPSVIQEEAVFLDENQNT